MDLSGIAQNVLDFCRAEGIELTDDLTQVEATLTQLVRQIGAKAIEQHLASIKLGYQGSAIPCPCGGVQRFVGHRGKQVATLLGTVRIRRAYYRCRACRASALPYDAQAGLGDHAASEGLAQAAALLGMNNPFDQAHRLLYALTGQRLSACTIERITEQVGQQAVEQQRREAAAIESWRSPPPEVQPERLYVAVDGTMVHQQDGWHEVKCVTCYWYEPDGRRQVRYAAHCCDAKQFVAYVWALACRCGLESARQVVLLGDGADWIWRQVGGLLKEAVCIVDWYHAVEHLWAAGRALYGEGSEATQRWVKDCETLLWEGQVEALRRRLEAERARSRSPAKREALRGLIGYLEKHAGRMDYGRFRAMGLDIGSGCVESACKHVVAARLKRSGMRWSRSGSQAVLSLRTTWLNGQWKALWARHPLARAA
ncbi:MAG TPA: ISKra4 family transposase [Thiotrichales bacterium]|nr:ISKra4 family transposase [Thiotrichales bacterium]